MPPIAIDFLHRIQADPDADGPRLVYADWLDEQGQCARAEFIRVQCAAAALPVDDPHCEKLRKRADILLEQHRVAWSAPLPGLAIRWDWRRGFPENVRLEAKVFLARGEDLFAAIPIRHLELLDVAAHLNALARSPLLERMASLTISASTVGDSIVRSLVGSQSAGRLTALHLPRNAITDAAIFALAAAPQFARLTALDLSENEIGTAGAYALAAAGNLAGLVALRLRSNPLGSEGAAAILTSNRLLRLRELDLSQTGCTPLPLDRGPACLGITTLNLSGNDLGDVGARCLSAWPPLVELRELDLSRTGIGDEGAAALAESPLLARLHRIALNGNRITETGKRQLLAAPRLQQVTSWQLRDNQQHSIGN